MITWEPFEQRPGSLGKHTLSGPKWLVRFLATQEANGLYLTSYQQLTISDQEHYGWGITCQAASVLVLVFLPLVFSQGGPDKGSAAIDGSLLTACVRW